MENQTTSMSDVQLKKLAIDISDGKVFTDTMIPPDQYQMVSIIFMPLIFLGKEKLEELANTCGLLYEYYDKAGPRSVNGFPIFFSFNSLNKEDIKKVDEYYKKIEEAKKSL